MTTLNQQTALVIGGSSGIGLAAVRRLAAAGARVTAAGRDEKRARDAVAGLGDTLASRVDVAALDANDRAALDAYFERSGPLDHLVLTLSGGEGAGALAQLDLAALRRGFEAKFWPQLAAAQAALRRLAPGGSITFVSAISARIANPGFAGLAAINGALEAMIGSLARELAPTRVNAVSPGVIDTPWWDRMPAATKATIFAQQAERNPAGRVGTPDDVAQAVQFLVENRFMTGAVIECDGGMRLL